MLKIKDVLDVKLQDDTRSMDGGISFAHESVQDFASECNLSFDDDISKLNKVLIECGIKLLDENNVM